MWGEGSFGHCVKERVRLRGRNRGEDRATTLRRWQATAEGRIYRGVCVMKGKGLGGHVSFACGGVGNERHALATFNVG
ncbi:hypothetical protein KDA_46220 [Dictyobacter alpinus]|uniref:Uncharacterized protein n=1 Tax=Dictyobacter alpinus TaxID=2014873 RepID=A0A402BCL2_9CHLR|nr:hypothetical protein KDA_46220 [Dictyobacter alpinus]